MAFYKPEAYLLPESVRSPGSESHKFSNIRSQVFLGQSPTSPLAPSAFTRSHVIP